MFLVGWLKGVRLVPVSYTHLDVYKRQRLYSYNNSNKICPHAIIMSTNRVPHNNHFSLETHWVIARSKLQLSLNGYIYTSLIALDDVLSKQALLNPIEPVSFNTARWPLRSGVDSHDKCHVIVLIAAVCTHTHITAGLCYDSLDTCRTFRIT